MTLSELKDIIDPFNPIRIFYGNTFKDAQTPIQDTDSNDFFIIIHKCRAQTYGDQGGKEGLG